MRMKAKKPLLLIALAVSLLALLVMTWAGSALAAPSPLDNHHSAVVSGSVEYVGWVFGPSTYDKGGYSYWPGNMLTWKLHGDLEGTYTQTLTYISPLSNPAAYVIEGSAMFTGTILGVNTTWTACVHGAGLLDVSDPANHPFKGKDFWTSTLTGSVTPAHMRGSIFIAGTYDYGVSPDHYTYAGLLVW